MQSTISIPRLRAAIHGRVITPSDPGQDQARTVFYGGIDQRRPAVIVRAANAGEVGRVVSLAVAAAATAWPGTAPATAASCSTCRP